MKQTNKLILAVTSYALAFVLVLGGSLYALADPALSAQPDVTPDDPSSSEQASDTPPRGDHYKTSPDSR